MSIAVNYRTEGPEHGRTLVLSGSIGSDLRMWDPQVSALIAGGYRVVRYDHRGHGGSPLPGGPSTMAGLGGDAVALLNRLGIEQADWVGLSLGGMVGMWMAQRVPDRIRTLTLLCTSARLPADVWAERARQVRAQGTRAITHTTVRRWFTADWRAAHPELSDGYEAMIAAQPAEGYASCCAAIETMTIEAELPAITVPTLVVSGADDPATPPDHGRAIAAVVPDARFEIVSPGAHLANVENPDRINNLILRQLKENS